MNKKQKSRKDTFSGYQISNPSWSSQNGAIFLGFSAWKGGDFSLGTSFGAKDFPFLVQTGELGNFEAPCYRFAGKVPCLLDLLHYESAKKKISTWAPAKIMNELTAGPTTIRGNHTISTTGSFCKTTFTNLIQLYSLLFLLLFFITSITE
jgi:hypothetical protein